MIRLFKVWMAEDVDNYILPVLHSGYIGEGPKSKEFETKFGEFIKNPNTVLVNSGTSAITLALKLANIGYGDKIISTANTCLSTNMAVLSIGAVPVWADILKDGTLDPYDVEERLTSDIKAILCMDWGGTPCMLDELKLLAEEHNIPLIEDACQSVGSSYNGVPIGSHADYVAFSFQAIKHLTTVDGGALAINTNDEDVYKAVMLRWFGLDRAKGADMRCNQDPPLSGYKWQTNDVLSSIGLANLNGLQDRLDIVRENAEYYNERFDYHPPKERQSGYWLYTIFVNDVQRFIRYMKDYGVECSQVHDRNDTKTIFKDSVTNLPGVDWFDKHHVCIPVGWWVTKKEREYIGDLVEKYL